MTKTPPQHSAKAQERIRHPFIQIEDGMYDHLFIDHRRIVSIRPPAYAAEKHAGAGAIIVEDGTRMPYAVEDKPEFILDLIKAAGGGATFITLSFEDGSKIFVDAARIASLKEASDRDSGSVLFVDGYPNIRDGEASWSIIVTESVEDVLKMIRQAALA